MMSERPILFNSEMILAILDGRKTQTRRLLKKQPLDILPMHVPNQWVTLDTRDPNHGSVIKCRFGTPGDRLWVRETWRPWSWHEGEPIQVQFKADRKHAPADNTSTLSMERYDKIPEWEESIWLQIEEELKEKGVEPDGNGWYHFDGDPPLKWRPSLFMPRWASRILLKITKVRIERLQEISMQEAVAEGVPVLKGCPEPRISFHDLWDELYAKGGYSWDSNPWVWVIEFEIVK